jgi:hypothetical protein
MKKQERRWNSLMELLTVVVSGSSGRGIVKTMEHSTHWQPRYLVEFWVSLFNRVRYLDYDNGYVNRYPARLSVSQCVFRDYVLTL